MDDLSQTNDSIEFARLDLGGWGTLGSLTFIILQEQEKGSPKKMIGARALVPLRLYNVILIIYVLFQFKQWMYHHPSA